MSHIAYDEANNFLVNLSTPLIIILIILLNHTTFFFRLNQYQKDDAQSA